MSHTAVLPLPVIENWRMDTTLTTAPKKDKPTTRNAKAIPVTIEEFDTTDLLGASFVPTVIPSVQTQQEWSESLERVFYDEHANGLYKLYINGTWEFIGNTFTTDE